MSIPNWYELILLGLAAFRTWRLIAEDDITDGIRRRVTRLGPKWKMEGDPVPAEYRVKLMQFVLCPWCFGFWIAAGWWGLWQAWPHGTLVAASVMAISAILAFLAAVPSGE